MDKGKFSDIGKAVDNFATVFICTLMVLQLPYVLSKFFWRESLEDPVSWVNPPTIVMFFLPPVFRTLVRISVLFDGKLRKSFEERADSIRTLKDRCGFFALRPGFWLEAAVYSALYWILPLRWFCMPIADRFFDGTAGFTEKAVVFVLLFPMLMLLNLHARLSAMNVWQSSHSGGHSKKFTYSEKHQTEYLMKYMIPYALSATVVCFSGPFLGMSLVSLFKAAAEVVEPIRVLLIAAAILLVWLTVLILRAVFKRRSFLKKLRKVCRDSGYELSGISHPYLSVWMFGEGENFSVQTDTGRYSCKLIGGLSRHVPMVLCSDGQGYFLHSLRLFGDEILQDESWFGFAYESDAPKILIVNPVPKKLSANVQGKQIPLDNSVRVGDFTVYTATAFLNAAERRALDNKNT